MAPEPEPDDHGLAAALARHPDARVTGVTVNGEFCALPPELGATHERIEAETMFDVAPRSEWPKIVAGWQRVLQYGYQADVLVGNDGREVTVLGFDARSRYGIIVVLLVPDPELGRATRHEHRPVRSRFGTFHRDMLSIVRAQDEGARALLGWELEDLAERSGRDLIHPDDVPNAEEVWFTALQFPGEAQRWRGRHLHADGSYRWIEFTTTNRLDELGYVVSEMMDISEEMATAQALRQRDELLARLNEALPLGVLVIGADRRILYANYKLPAIFGHDPAVTLDEQVAAVAAGDREALLAAVGRTLLSGEDNDLEVRVEPGRVCAVSVRSLREDGAVTGAVLCVSDITEATILRQQLEVQATRDRLTGCHNRGATMAALETALAQREARQTGTAVLFIDLDGFKPINDELGHAAGDRLLVAVAERLRRLVRDADTVGRIGGDEFLLVCPGTDRATGEAIAGRVTKALREPVALREATVQVGASVGVAWDAGRDATPDALVAAADAAMYEVKRTRRAKLV